MVEELAPQLVEGDNLILKQVAVSTLKFQG